MICLFPFVVLLSKKNNIINEKRVLWGMEIILYFISILGVLMEKISRPREILG
jgi:hypothetical protein